MIEPFIVAHPILGPVSFIIFRALIVLVPFFPGVLADIPALKYFGWIAGFFYTEIGILLGASIAFALARYGKKILVRLFPFLSHAHHTSRWTERDRFFAIVITRLSTLPLFDYIAGFSRMSYTTFLSASVIGSIPPTFLFYYFGGKAFDFGLWYGVAFITCIIILAVTGTIKHIAARKTIPLYNSSKGRNDI
ncbi:MAG: VTT domain-containing protein [Parcubacteria group bacterium]|nr:VTT domain-containing protein [Parcubacteria group bacterium]